MKRQKTNMMDATSVNEPAINMSDFFDVSRADSTVNIFFKAEDFNIFLNRVANYISKTVSERTAREKSNLRYTVDEVVEKLKVSKPTLNNWEKRGYLVPTRVGRRVLYVVDDVDEILNQNKKR